MNKPTPNAKTISLPITHLGGLGDGIGQWNGKPVYVPLSCPGDVADVQITAENQQLARGELASLEIASPHRQTPPCEYFSRCGGCSLQHLNHPTYAAFKHSILLDALETLGASNAEIWPMVEAGPASRRRVELKVKLEKGQVSLGYFARNSHDLIAINHCPVSEPAISESIPTWQTTLQRLKKPGRIATLHLTALEGGLDALLTVRSALHAADIKQLTTFAHTAGLLRLSMAEDDTPQRILYDSNNVTLTSDSATVAMPPGAFLQAATAGQQALTDFVTHHLANCNHVTDFYAGCGTYSFPLLKTSRHVSAYEGAEDMVLAMHNAARTHGLEERLTATTRDLFKQPITKNELIRCDGAVINPPRAGALPQVRELAHSNVEKLVMVSCNPATFIRDARVLLKAGWQLTHAQAVDQFYWSGHLEIVATFLNLNKSVI